jgi:hypothetical protein
LFHFSKSGNESEIALNFDQALAAAKKMPTYINENNEGKGVPVTYTLMPMCKVQSQLKVINESKETKIASDIDEATLTKCMTLLGKQPTTLIKKIESAVQLQLPHTLWQRPERSLLF